MSPNVLNVLNVPNVPIVPIVPNVPNVPKHVQPMITSDLMDQTDFDDHLLGGVLRNQTDAQEFLTTHLKLGSCCGSQQVPPTTTTSGRWPTPTLTQSSSALTSAARRPWTAS